MAQKPAHLSMSGGKKPRQSMWEAIRSLRSDFTSADVATKSRQEPRAVEAYITALWKAGVIALAAPRDKPSDKKQWNLIADEGAEHPRLNPKGERIKCDLGVENLWRSLRILRGELTAADLAAAASIGDAQIGAGAANRYLSALAEAGYLKMTRGIPGRPATYRLLPERYTGPKHPIVQRYESVQVYDPNLDEVVFARAAGNEGDPVELTWLRLENKRLRVLLGQWLEGEESGGATRSLIERTQLELIPMPRSALQ